MTTDAEITAIANEAARKAIEQFWLTLGVDVTEPEGIIELQADLRHARYMRQLSGKVGGRALSFAITLSVGGVLVILAQKVGLPVDRLLR